MELGDRLGIVGIIVAVAALGITIMWPTKRPIAYGCFLLAGILCACWGYAEFKVHHPKEIVTSQERPKQAPTDKPTAPVSPPPHPPKSGPLWTWEPIKPDPKISERPGVTVLITARQSISDMIFDVKCSVPCALSAQQSQALGFMSGTWFDTSQIKDDQTAIRVKVITPNRLDVGNELGLYFISKDSRELDISWVRDARRSRR